MARRLKVVHIVGTISLGSSGPSKSVPALCQGLAAAGADVELHYLDFGARPTVPGVITHAYDQTTIPGLRHACWSTNMLRALYARARSDVLLHSHGLWHFPTIYPAWLQGLRGCKLVVSPRGTLAKWPLRRSRFKKAISLRIGQRYGLEHADLLHATSEAEAEDVRRFGLRGNIVVIPNAIEVPPLTRQGCDARSDVRTVLFLARIHPIKAVDRLLRAWAKVEPDFAKWQLVIAGPSELGYRSQMEKLARELRLGRVTFPGELLGDHKSAAYRNADVVVLPSHHENFGMVVAEALSHGKPVIASRGTPWACLVERAAGWWVDNDPESLEGALRQALGTPPAQLAAMGIRGYELAAERFSIAAVAQQMLREYENIVRRSQPT